MSKTNNTFKMLYVLAIFMIVDGHIGGFDYLNLNELLPYQNYHIALFMFTSGYFLNLTRSYKDFFIRKISKIILPLYIWNIFYGIVCWYLNSYHGFSIGEALNVYNLFYAPIVDGHQYIYNMASWFLIPLFLVQTVSFVILKPFADNKGNCSKTVVLSFFVTILLLGLITLTKAPEHMGKRDIILTVLRTCYFLPPFAFGWLYKNLLEKHDDLSTPLYLSLLLGTVTFLCYLYPGYRHVPSWLDFCNAPAWVLYTICFCAILFWLRIAKVLTPIYEKSASLQYIGNHTFDIMMHHFVGFMLIKASLSGLSDFNILAYKTNIWYTYFPNNNEILFSWSYIVITIVIALLTGFTSRKIYDIIKPFSGKLLQRKVEQYEML